MAKIRGKKEGSIHQRPNGSWRVQISLDGQRLSFTARTRRECQEWLKKTISQIDQGMKFSSATVKLGEFMNTLLISAKSSVRQTTWSHYEQLTRNYVLPNLGQIKIKDLNPDQIQRFYNHLLSTEVGIHTVIKIHAMLHGAIEQAVKVGLINRNVIDAAIPPREPATEMKILDESQVSQLLIAARGSRMEALLHLAVSTGMRQMEILGLKWNDLDWIKKTLKVERQLVRGEGVQFSQPKTRHGRRMVVLGDRATEILHRHYDSQNEERRKAGESWTEYGLIFTSGNGTPIHFRNLMRDFKNLLKAAGLPEIRFHDLRHTASSLMLNHGIPVIVVSRRLGHARPSITLDIYGHLVPGMQEEAAQMMDDLITPVEFQQLRATAPDLHPILTNNEPTPHI
jgi:integrase